MTETAKTFVFLGAAALAVFAAVATRPSSGDYDATDQVGKPLVKAFEPSEAKRLSIADFDEETFTPKTFEVAEKEGLWTLPSKGGYPADGEKQLAKAVTEVSDREVLLVASEDPDDHAQYGVIDPTSAKLEPGQTGVGERVTLSKGDGDSLVDLIIGKEVKDQENQHYVRRHNQDAVFVVNIDPENFSTDFGDWIEHDLLKISPWDISTVRIRDYTAELLMTLQGMAVDTNYRTDMTFTYDDGESKWKLKELKQATDPKKGEFEEVELAADQELNNDKLQALKTALDDLKIVDVSSKPEGLSANLKAGEEFMKDQQSLVSLVRKGFAPIRNPEGDFDILSSEGEVICTMKDGVEYVLRFGNLKMDASGDSKEENPPANDANLADGESVEEKDGVDRYLFVMARFNENVIAKPELEIVPELPKASDQTESATEKATEETGGDEEKASTDKSEEAGSNDAAEETASEDQSDADKAETGEADTDEAGTDEAGDDTPSELEKAVALRKEVEQRNARLLDEYEDKLAAGRKRVKELNARFGDWYYVISNDVYEKIHLSQGDVIKVKEAEEEEGSDAAADSNVGADSAFGPPGSPVPGLPGLSEALKTDSDDPATDEQPSEETANEGPATEEAASEEKPQAESAEETPAEQPAPAEGNTSEGQ